MGRIIRCTALAFVALAMPAVAAESKRTLSDADFEAATPVASRIVEHFAHGEWQDMGGLATDEFASRWADEVAPELERAHADLLGLSDRIMLADEIVEVSPGCHRWHYAVAYEEHAATMSLDLCGSGRAWAMNRFQLFPSIDTVALLALRSVVRQMRYEGAWDYSCEGTDEVAIGGRVTCSLTRFDNRETTQVVLVRKATAHLVVESSSVAATAPEATREVLEPVAMAAAGHIAAGRYDELMRGASPNLHGGDVAAQIPALLASLQSVHGPVLRSRWDEMSVRPQTNVVDVTIRQVYGDRERALRLAYVPDRGRWVLFGVDAGIESDPAALEAASRDVVAVYLRSLGGDPAATIECPWQSLAKREFKVTCNGVVFGQSVRVTVEPVADAPTSVSITSEDLLVTTTSAIARLRRVLGWSATRVECDQEGKEPVERSQCRISSPQGDRVLTIQREGRKRSVIDNARRR